MAKEKLVKIKGKKVKAGKVQHLEVGKVYEVPKRVADAAIANGQASKPGAAKEKED